MKLEFLPEGSPDCPLIRLYEFGAAEAVQLRRLFTAVADGSQSDIHLGELAYIEAIAGCELLLRSAKRDEGIRQIGPSYIRLRRNV